MNTQAHILLAATLLCRPSNAGPIISPKKAGGRRSHWAANTAVIVGAVLPDASLFLMFSQARLRGIDHDVIWGEMYFSSFWQNQAAITNSIPVYLLVSLVGFFLSARLLGDKPFIQKPIIQNRSTSELGLGANTARASWRAFFLSIFTALMLFGLAALLHCVSDFPLHVDDGHPHFWPFSHWIFASPVSYWDSNHYASYWRPIELCLVTLCAFVIWRRFSSKWVRGVTILLVLSYPVMMIFWFYSMG